MALFGFGKKQDTQVQPTAAPAPVAATSGKISLTKGQRVSLTKPDAGGSATITVSNGWAAKGKDYDLKALVLYRDGRTVYVGAANSDERIATPEGAVRHSGDSREPGVDENLSIRWDPSIDRIAVSSYSALENGTGSFKEYGVFVEIKNGTQVLRISAADASADGHSYTLCFGEIIMETDGTMAVAAHEMYSKRGSERRVGYKGQQVVMDAGPEGKNK